MGGAPARARTQIGAAAGVVANRRKAALARLAIRPAANGETAASGPANAPKNAPKIRAAASGPTRDAASRGANPRARAAATIGATEIVDAAINR